MKKERHFAPLCATSSQRTFTMTKQALNRRKRNRKFFTRVPFECHRLREYDSLYRLSVSIFTMERECLLIRGFYAFSRDHCNAFSQLIVLYDTLDRCSETYTKIRVYVFEEY